MMFNLLIGYSLFFIDDVTLSFCVSFGFLLLFLNYLELCVLFSVAFV